MTLADPKAIGEDIERLVIDVVSELDPAPSRDQYFDAISRSAIDPEASSILTLGSVPIVPVEERIEIKAARRRVSNGDRTKRGLWLFKREQHEQLIESAAWYLLAVYTETEEYRVPLRLYLTSATIIDELLTDQWTEIDRREGAVAQLSWSRVFDDVDLEEPPDDPGVRTRLATDGGAPPVWVVDALPFAVPEEVREEP